MANAEPLPTGTVEPEAGDAARSAVPWALGAAVLFLALNLRLAVAALSPVLGAVEATTGLSSTGAGVLTTVPLLAFALFGALTPALTRRLGGDGLLLGAMVGVVAGSALRVAPGTLALFAGTAIAGAGIAVANVALPGLVKASFYRHADLMTGLYTMTLSGGAAVAAGTTVPIARVVGGGWRPAVALWGVLALAGAAAWLPRVGRQRRQPAPDVNLNVRVRSPRLWADPLAWAVTVFMGMQSLGYYAALSWVPTIFSDHGVSAAQAGWLLSFSSLPGIVAAVGAPVAARRIAPPLLVVATVAAGAVGFAGLLADPVGLPYVWMTFMGIGQGAAISLALTFIVARSHDPVQAAQLSTMAQGAGYLIASVGPLGMGAVHDLTGGWTVPLLVLLVLLVPELIAGLLASRDRLVG